MKMNLGSKSIAKALIVLSALTFVPLTFLNFDTHHDGLIVQTVINLKSVLTSQGLWPYNQYGSFWIFIFTWGTWPLPSDSILVGIRLITIIAYWLAGFLLYKLAREFLNETPSHWVVIYFFLSHPFFGGWNSSFLPWPSAIAMPIFLATILIVVRKLDSSQKNKHLTIFDFITLATAGGLLAMLYGTRLQIGILGSLLALIFLQLGLGIKASLSFVAGNVLTTAVWSLYLFSNGWLSDSLVDSIKLASTFLSGEHIAYPQPTATLALSLFLSIVVVALLKLRNNLMIRIAVILSPLLVPIAILGIRKLRNVQNGQNDVINYVALLHRKLMAGFLFATLILASVFIAMRLYSTLRSREPSPSLKWVFISLSSIVASFQAWPFFDQMHIWWGSVPGVLLIVHLISKVGTKFNFSQSVANLIGFVILIVMLVPLFAQFAEDRKQLVSFRQNHVYGLTSYEDENVKLAKFFESSMPRGSKVLNLCPNADPFFVDLDYVQVSRFPVYWMTFSRFPEVQSEFFDNDPEFIVTCKNEYYSAEATLAYRKLQKEVVRKHKSNYEILSQYSRSVFEWEIYVRK
jgi:hypothetical protein